MHFALTCTIIDHRIILIMSEDMKRMLVWRRDPSR